MQAKIKEILNNSIQLKQQLIKTQLGNIEFAAKEIIKCYQKGGKLVLFGNGGSAADAQHIAAELVHKFEINRRKALPAIALSANTSIMTAIGNDWGFDELFSRQIEALAAKGDVVIGISTSGNSKNVEEGLMAAKKQGAYTIGLLGRDGGRIKELTHHNILVPGANTARIQESHITIGHVLCYLVETRLFGK